MQYPHRTPRPLLKRGIVFNLALTFLIPAACLAQSLTAAQVLKKVSETYLGLRSFRLVKHQECTVPRDGGFDYPSLWSGPFGSLPAAYETDLAVSTPGKIRLVVSSPEGKIVLVSDGRKTWAYIPSLNEYEEATAAPLVQELRASPIALISDDLARYKSLSHEAKGAKLRDEETLILGGQDVRCYVVDLPPWRRLWVDEQRFIVLREQWQVCPCFDELLDGTTFSMGAVFWTSQLTKADLGPIPDDFFQFGLPSGARRVDSFSAPTGPVPRDEEVLAGRIIGTENAEYLLQTSKARDFTVGSLGGENVSLHRFRGKIVVLIFWASWCQPCQEELAAIQRLHDQLASKGVVFLGIDDESPKIVEDFVKGRGYTFPMLLDSKKTIHRLYGVRWVPRTVVINRKGKIVIKYVGADGEAQLRRALKSAGLDTTKP